MLLGVRTGLGLLSRTAVGSRSISSRGLVMPATLFRSVRPLALGISIQPLGGSLLVRRSFSSSKVVHPRWDSKILYADGADRYTRLNRFQQYNHNGNGSGDKSVRNATIIGLGAMVGFYFGSQFLFDYVPGFTYFKTHPKDFVYAILGLNLAVYGLWQLPRCWGFLQKYMLLQKSHIPSSWSIVGSAFSHQEFWHLGMNMLALWSFGTSIASMLGTANFFSLYMNSAIAGSLFSLWYPRLARMALMGPSLGASGALFGVLGCFSYLVPHAKILLFVFPVPGGAWVAFLASVAWNAAGCVLRWGSFDYAAHLGGSAIGVLYGWIIAKQVERRREERFERETRWLR